MIGTIFRSRFTPLAIAFAALIPSPQAQDDIRIKKDSTTAFPGPISAIFLPTQAETALPKQITDIFGNLLLTHIQQPRLPSGATAIGAPKRSPRPANPKAMTMLSISCYQQDQTEPDQALLIHCRTDGYLSNAQGGGRILIKGVVTDDVVSAGKILIPAGSKVTGIGHVNPDSARLESKGDWSIIADDRQVRVHAEVQDADTGFHGVQGKETSFQTQATQTQTVARDTRYYFIASRTPFVLSITGEINVTLLQPESSQ